MGGYVDDINVRPEQNYADRQTFLSAPIYSAGLGLWSSLALAGAFIFVVIYFLRNR